MLRDGVGEHRLHAAEAPPVDQPVERLRRHLAPPHAILATNLVAIQGAAVDPQPWGSGINQVFVRVNWMLNRGTFMSVRNLMYNSQRSYRLAMQDALAARRIKPSDGFSLVNLGRAQGGLGQRAGPRLLGADGAVDQDAEGDGGGKRDEHRRESAPQVTGAAVHAAGGGFGGCHCGL